MQDAVEAQHMLGTMYAMGAGVARDYVKAYAYFMVVSAQWGNRYIVDPALLQKISPAQIARADRLVYRCAGKGYRNCRF
jgi:hypothetical protein